MQERDQGAQQVCSRTVSMKKPLFVLNGTSIAYKFQKAKSEKVHGHS